MRRGQVHGGVLARLALLEQSRAARCGGPLVGIEDPVTGMIRADGGREYATADAFFAAGRIGAKMPLLIRMDTEPSPYNRPEEETQCPN